MERWILHADMDAFYASVEQRDDPRLRGKPVIVGATSPRGVVSAASYEARRFGVHSAMPGFRARQLCPQGVFLPGDMEKYSRVSRDVHRVFAEFTDTVEPLALDEAFLDISGSVALFGPPLTIGRRIREEVRARTELSVSVGIAPNKLVAKIACGLSKPDGLLLVTPEEVEPLLAPLPIRKLWGVGPRTEEALLAAGLRTFGDVASASPGALHRAVGSRAEELARRARGVDDRPVIGERMPKSIGEEATFEADVLDADRISAALTAHAEAVARRARRAGFVGRTVTLKIKLARARGSHPSRSSGLSEPDYPLLSRNKTLREVTADGALLREVALELWARAEIREPVRLLGVSLSNLQPAAGGRGAPHGAPWTPPGQLELFDGGAVRGALRAPGLRPSVPAQSVPAQSVPGRRAGGDALGRALDAIEDKFGRDAVRRAVQAPPKITQTDRRKVGEEPDES